MIISAIVAVIIVSLPNLRLMKLPKEIPDE
jgi:hypothetical protein